MQKKKIMGDEPINISNTHEITQVDVSDTNGIEQPTSILSPLAKHNISWCPVLRSLYAGKLFTISSLFCSVTQGSGWVSICHARAKCQKYRDPYIDHLTCRSTARNALHSPPSSGTTQRSDAGNSKGRKSGLDTSGTGGSSDEDGGSRRHGRRRGKHELPAVVGSGHCASFVDVGSRQAMCRYL